MARAPYLRPGAIVRRALNPLVMRLGLATTLAVPGRRSGRWLTVPLNVLQTGGRRYLVSVRGETDWVRNLRAAGGGELRRRGRVERVRAVEVPPGERAPLLEAYLARWGRQVRSLFDRLPDTADHPVFRIEPEERGGGSAASGYEPGRARRHRPRATRARRAAPGARRMEGAGSRRRSGVSGARGSRRLAPGRRGAGNWYDIA
jgi:deazaflavin-dependent oxidoreductase (nitroreductase family)